MIGNLFRKKEDKPSPNKPIKFEGDLLAFLKANKDFFKEYESKHLGKPQEDIESEFKLGQDILNLKINCIFEKLSRIIIILPRYEFWTYIYLSIKFLKLGYKVTILYHKWTEEIVAEMQKYTNFLDYANLEFALLDNYSINLEEKPYVINFTDTYKGIKNTVPAFSTAYISENADLDYAIEYIVTHAFSFGGLKKSNLKRVIIEENLYEEFVKKIQSKVFLGHTINKTLIRSKQTSEQFREIVSVAISEGAEVLFGDASISPDKHISNVILANVTLDMQVFQKKFYGPLLSLMNKKDIPIEKILKQQPSRGIVIFGNEKNQLPPNFIYAYRTSNMQNNLDQFLEDNPTLEYLIKYIIKNS